MVAAATPTAPLLVYGLYLVNGAGSAVNAASAKPPPERCGTQDGSAAQLWLV